MVCMRLEDIELEPWAVLAEPVQGKARAIYNLFQLASVATGEVNLIHVTEDNQLLENHYHVEGVTERESFGFLAGRGRMTLEDPTTKNRRVYNFEPKTKITIGPISPMFSKE